MLNNIYIFTHILEKLIKTTYFIFYLIVDIFLN